MERKAHYALIGLFTFAVVAGAFGFIFWLHHSSGKKQAVQYRVIFDSSVSGLQVGGNVLFNGIRVGEVTNLRLDPFERTGWPNNGTKEGAQQYFDWFKYQFWRFVFVQQIIAKEIQTFLDYPPMQRGASFNLDAVKAEMSKKMAEAEAASKGTSN